MKIYLALFIDIEILNTYIEFRWDRINKQMVQKINC